VHRLSGRSGPLQRLNCSALAPSLVESELFGHVKGAVTGATESRAGLLESAAGGTLFLDEIGELPEAVQAKLLRAIESKEVLRLGSTRPTRVDVRFISATHRDLASEIARGRFRADLFYRLDGLTLTIPPLRRRRDQIGRLALQFLREAHERHHGKKPQQVSPELLRQLQSYDWPGNVRELKAVVERAVLLARGGEVGPSHVRVSPMAPSAPAPPPTDGDVGEKQRILDALEACAGNQTRAAQKLGMARSTLAVKLTLYRIPRPRK
jgi:DNA-binding NtrC family response regulator